MSDDEDYLMDDGDEETYDFEYEDDYDDDAGDGELDADIENRYYNAKGLKLDDPDAAMQEFLAVVAAEEEKGDWGFRALKQIVKLSFRRGREAETLEYYKQMLTYTRTAVTRNHSEKSINNILDLASSSSDVEFMEQFYATTLTSLQDVGNDRLWLKTNLKLAKLWLDLKEYLRFTRILRSIFAVLDKSGRGDQNKDTTRLEAYALEIQMCTETKNRTRLKQLYNQATRIRSAIPHPRVMGVIRECGSKELVLEEADREDEWSAAQTDFFESFHNYDEAGDPRRIQVLKYLLLANMLMSSSINPFDSQETKPYRNDPQVIVMKELVTAFHERNIDVFQQILKQHESEIMGDSFIRRHIDEVMRNIRTETLLELIVPYTRMSLDSIASKLNVNTPVVMDLLQQLILDGRVNGRIDETARELRLIQRATSETRHAEAFESACKSIARIVTTYETGLGM